MNCKNILSFLVFVLVAHLANAQDKIKFENLFDGKTLNGWEQVQGTARYEVKDEMIVGTTALNSPNSFLATKKNYGNFILELDFKVDAGLNSGIQFRSKKDKNYKEGIVHGYQVEIDPSERNWTGGIYDEKRRGWLADLSKNEDAQKAFKPGAWNHFRIEASGYRMYTWINGVLSASLVDDLSASGFIGLQVHATKEKKPLKVYWKNIRIQNLDDNFPNQHKQAQDLKKKVTKSAVKTSLNAFSFAKKLNDKSMSLFDLIDYSAEQGFDAVDLTGYYFPGYPAIPSDEYLNDLKRHAFKMGIDISGTAVRNNFADPDPAKRAADVKHVKEWIDVAVKLGAPVVRVFAGPVPVGYENKWNDVAKYMAAS